MLQGISSLRASLTKTREAVFGRVVTLLGQSQVTPGLWDELEALLIQADVGVSTTLELLDRLRKRATREGITQADMLRGALKAELRAMLIDPKPLDVDPTCPLTVILIVGVNGSGKTTSIAKLAYSFTSQGKQVVLAAADTFRAAAIEQLKHWGEKVGAEVIAHQPGGDPGAVAYDAVQAGYSRHAQAVIIDTAGRLHTKFNLMEELKKIKRVVAKHDASAPHQVLLVMDATTGQNGLAQAKHFAEAVDVTDIFLAKLDGTARGGIVFAICDQLGIPISHIGTGEKLEDVAPFDAEVFVNAIFS
jgi:fused signal recognition particle receptor